MVPDGDLQFGKDGVTIEFGPNANKNRSEFGKKLNDLIDSTNTWTIIPDVKDSKNFKEPVGGPFTKPANANGLATASGLPGLGSGGEIHIPTSKSEYEFGAYDPNDRVQLTDPVIIFGHELFGHAWFLNNGTHDGRPQKWGDRPGHDQAIKVENLLRKFLAGKNELKPSELRGLWANPMKGESMLRMRGTIEWKRP